MSENLNIKELFEKYKEQLNFETFLANLIKDPLLYISYAAMIVYYLIFSSVHLLALSYCCTTYRNIKSVYLNDFSAFTIIIIIYNIYQICNVYLL